MEKEEPVKVDPVEVFQVIGASDGAEPETLARTAEEVDASPEVVEFMETLPPDVSEPSDVVAAAADSDNNEAGVELEVHQDELGQLTIDDVKTGGANTGA